MDCLDEFTVGNFAIFVGIHAAEEGVDFSGCQVNGLVLHEEKEADALIGRESI